MDKDIVLRDKLRQLGYDAKLVNGTCFDIDQNGWCHYLSNKEAIKLSELNHPVNLMDYAKRDGLNYWYNF